MGGTANGRGLRWLAVAGVAWLCAGCEAGDLFDATGVPVAWVGSEPVAIEDLQAGGPRDTRELRLEAIERGIADLLAEREARRRGLGYTEQAAVRIAAVRRAAKLRERKILRDVLFEVFESEVEVSDAQLRAHFEQHHATTHRRLVTLRTTVFGSRDAAERAHAALGSAALDLSAPDSAGASTFGPTLVRKLPSQLREAARQLRSIGASIVTEVADGWSIVELVDEQPDEPRSFEQARESVERDLRRQLARDRFELELERLRERADVRIETHTLDADRLWVR